MGKKRITNKFAQTKRIISAQDHRMYIPYNQENKIRRKRRREMQRENKWN